MSINAINPTNQSNYQSFKGKMSTNENGTPYYKANTGLKVGCAAAALSGLGYFGGERLMKSLSNMEGVENVAKQSFQVGGKGMKYVGMFAVPASIICGLIVDYARNNKAKNCADLIKEKGPDKALETSPNIEINGNGTPYYKSNDGKKLGALLGLACGCGVQLISLLTTKTRPTILGAIGGLGVYALSGLSLGALTDHFNNKGAEKTSLRENSSNSQLEA